jgi:ferrochelatase
MVQKRLGRDYLVQLAMRYQTPSIPHGLRALRQAQVSDLTVLPLFPQYASATVGSVHQRVMGEISRWPTIPRLQMISQFSSHPGIIKGFADNARRHQPDRHDHVLFSFHGIPQRHLVAADDSRSHCLARPDCCAVMGPHNHMCYSAQCYAMARLIAKQLSLSSDRYTVTFQSRLGRIPWTQPYTSRAIRRLGTSGARRLLVLCPSFVSDCLETLYEIQVENREIFQEAGGEELTLVEGLNDSPALADSLVDLIRG